MEKVAQSGDHVCLRGRP